MRIGSTAAAAALVCLVGAGAAGCSGGTAAKELSAKQLMDNANDTMNALKSVTIAEDTTESDGPDSTSRISTDLKRSCTFKMTWKTGSSLEQIRIGDTDYVRPNRAYLENWSGRAEAGDGPHIRWIKTPASESKPGDGLAECTREFVSFGAVKKGKPAKVDGRPAMSLVVTDKADKGSTFTFHVATEGKPYVLEVVYKGAKFHHITRFSGFDEPVDVRPPAKSDVLDMSGKSR